MRPNLSKELGRNTSTSVEKTAKGCQSETPDIGDFRVTQRYTQFEVRGEGAACTRGKKGRKERPK